MNAPQKDIPFLGHLEELRSRLIKSLFVLALTSIFSCVFADEFLKLLIKPVGHLVFTSPAEGFLATLNVTLWGGVILAFPFILYQFWAFVSQALTEPERKYVRIFGPFSLILFLGGIVFGYFVMVPISLRFLLGFSSASLVPMIRASEYLSFVGSFVLAFGVVFELPLILVFLAKIGIASPEFLRQQRRYAIVFIFILSAILTPPDCASQLLMAAPLLVLYELGILLSRAVYRPKL
ncbi:MAG TPA: twin-arginine translocase subunit TatC [Candidatus Omnitrophota bacterium]|nr:twin-arginine translocase subunit TatC [Candidatus Omnitrophota bacterium]